MGANLLGNKAEHLAFLDDGNIYKVLCAHCIDEVLCACCVDEVLCACCVDEVLCTHCVDEVLCIQCVDEVLCACCVDEVLCAHCVVVLLAGCVGLQVFKAGVNHSVSHATDTQTKLLGKKTCSGVNRSS